MTRWIPIVVLIAACGRGRFELHDDATTTSDSDGAGDAAPIVDQTCNLPIALGVMADSAPDASGGHWVAATRVANGILFAYTSAAGIAVTTIDLTTSPPTRSAETSLPLGGGGNIDMIASGDRLVFTSTGMQGLGTVITTTDLSLAVIANRLEPMVTAGAPDHTAPRPGGGVVTAGTGANLEQLAIFDADGGFVSLTTFPFANANGGSIVALAGGGYAAVWYDQAGGTCDVRVFDESLASVAHNQVAGCAYGRIVGSPDGSRIGISFLPTSVITSVTFDRALTTQSTAAPMSVALETPRLAASSDRFWTAIPVSGTQLAAGSTDLVGQFGGLEPLPPFTLAANDFTYDVVGDGTRAWAVWIDQVIGPTLYVAQLCP